MKRFCKDCKHYQIIAGFKFRGCALHKKEAGTSDYPNRDSQCKDFKQIKGAYL